MTYHRLFSLPLAFLVLVGCGKPPADNQAESGSAAAPAAEPATPAGEQRPEPVAAAAPDGRPLADLAYDQTTRTRSGEVAFSAAEHVLKVVQGERVTYYSTGPVAASLTPAEQQRLLGALAETFRYPAERTAEVSGTFVTELGGEQNELVTVGFLTADPVATAAQFYDERLNRSPTPVYRVATPYGGQQVVTYLAGMGARRYRVVLAPAGRGCLVSVTQSYLSGAPTVEFMVGQGVLKAASQAGS